jgi:hypothetical protein
LPQINVAGGFNFGGPRIVPQGRDDLTVVFADTFSKVIGRHSLRIGGEYRIFDSDFFQTDPGIFNFPTIPSFLAGNANSFSITLGTTQSNVDQNSLEFFATDTFKLRSNLTFDVGLRYAWNITPTEEFDRFVVFDPLTASLLRVGTDIDEVYEENAANFQPRVGVAWSPGKDGRTVVRAAYAIATEQPMTNAVFQLPTNPPIATPLTFTGTVRFDNAILLAGPAGLAPITVVHDYQNSYIQSWNLNVQREVFGDVVVMAGYFGSKGTNLRLSRNINQSVSGVRPYPRLSFSSPVLPGAALGNITQVEGTGNSRYDALWVSAKRRLSSGLQFNASYTWSKSIDNNSNSSPPGAVPFQNSYDVRNDRGLSDFDARHRFVLSGTYELPFEGNLLVEGWQFGAILQLQSGNPVNLVTASATINGVANTVRPDVIGPVEIVGSVDQWFNTASFVAVPRFGNFGRNVIVGPGFNNLDLSVLKNTKLTETVTLQLRAEAFNAFNTPNFGQPGRVVGTVAFGRITNTRVPTGDTGSSRQLQFALRVIF